MLLNLTSLTNQLICMSEGCIHAVGQNMSTFCNTVSHSQTNHPQLGYYVEVCKIPGAFTYAYFLLGRLRGASEWSEFRTEKCYWLPTLFQSAHSHSPSRFCPGCLRSSVEFARSRHPLTRPHNERAFTHAPTHARSQESARSYTGSDHPWTSVGRTQGRLLHVWEIFIALRVHENFSSTKKLLLLSYYFN